MAKQLPSTRIGVYECRLNGNWILKGKRIDKGYYGLFSDALLNSRIIPGLKELKGAGRNFEFPVLVVSYSLGEGDPPKPLPMPVPRNKLTVKSAGGLRKLKRMIGFPVARKKIPKSETWHRVIDAQDRVFKVEGRTLESS